MIDDRERFTEGGEEKAAREEANAAIEEAAYEARSTGNGSSIPRLIAAVQDGARRASERLVEQVQEHPLRTLALAAGAGFVLAAALRRRALPSLIRTALGVAGAVLLREIVDRGAVQIEDELRGGEF